MIPELGHFALILALVLSIIQFSMPLLGVKNQHSQWMSLAGAAAVAQFSMLVIAMAALFFAFISNDFSVQYVAAHSNSQLPLMYRFSALWGAHEGSLLLWVFLLNAWTFAVVLFSKSLPLEIKCRVLAVLGMISCGFLIFLLATSNPFLRLFPNVPMDGQDLNPLLQDPGLIIHPPMLYMGYVGFAVAFAFAITALLSGKMDAAWARWVKPWTLAAWCFLTFGIILGSWWAYRELGWGGWWFWDPVENASFLPWLAGTALIHSLAVAEKRNAFKAWTVLLAIICFSLSLLGTFIVRSGVIVSVHAFAVDPLRGVYMLAFLGLVIGLSLLLYAWRISKIRTDLHFGFFSRESFLLSNNILLTSILLTILLGTLYPLIIETLGFEKISVGPPYFNLVFIPFMVFLLFFMGFVPLLKWENTKEKILSPMLVIKIFIVCISALLLPLIFAKHFSFAVCLGLILAFWILIHPLQLFINKQNGKFRLQLPSRSQWGMIVAHMGVAITVIGVVLVSNYSIQREVRLQPGNAVELGEYSFQFLGTQSITGANYGGVRGGVLIAKNGKVINLLFPEQRQFNVQKTQLSKTAIDMNPFRDLYVALGEPLDQGAWSLRIYYKPFIRWIWVGGLFMILGGILALSDRRYRVRKFSKLSAG